MIGQKIIDGLREAFAHAREAGQAGGWGGEYSEDEKAALRRDLAAMNAEAMAAAKEAQENRK